MTTSISDHGIFSNLTHEQKLKLIVNDDVQWAKLRSSLRRSRATTSFALREVLPGFIDERIKEMEKFAGALNCEIDSHSMLSKSDISISKGARLYRKTTAIFGAVGLKFMSNDNEIAVAEPSLNQRKSGNHSRPKSIFS